MNKVKRGISIFLAIMMAISMLLCTSAYADTDTTVYKTGRIHVDNAASGGYSELEADGDVVPRKATSVDYPSSYSSVDEGYITSVKNQGNYGTCWAQSAAASAEASLIKNNGYSKSSNFSELHLSYYFYNSAYDALGMVNGDSTMMSSRYARTYSFLDMGGSNSFTPFTLARWTGVVDEGKYPDFAYSKARPSYKVTDNTKAYSLDEAHLTEAYWVSPSDLDDMKYMITKYGAGTIAYYASNDYSYNASTASYFYRGNNYPDHEVTVVGWDDNYPKTNFNSSMRPKSNGAWLVKNSWDTDWGDNGYFWLSYEDTSLCSDVASFYAFESADNYDNNYQYDGTSLYCYEEVNGAAYQANVFTADSNEYLKAVSFWTAQQNVSYSVQIYTDLTGTTNPENGKKALTAELTGTETYAGYHTVKLPSSIYLNEGEKYSVVIKLRANSDSSTGLFVDKTDSSAGWVIFTNSTKAGQSYFKSQNSSSWTDVSSRGVNYRIKAFTDEAEIEEIPVETDSEEIETDSNVVVSDSDYYYLDNPAESDSFWSDLWADLFEKYFLKDSDEEDSTKSVVYNSIKSLDDLKDGDKVVLHNGATSYTVLPQTVDGKSNVLAVSSVNSSADFTSEHTWTVRIENGHMYFEAANGKRLTASGKNTATLESVGSTLTLNEGIATGTFTIYSTGYKRYLRYNDSVKGYRFYKSIDESSEFTIFKEAEKTSRSKVVSYGDVSGDGEITMVDVVATQRVIANLADAETATLKMLADVDGDSAVTMQDVVSMQKHVAGLTSLTATGRVATLVFSK